MGLLAESERHHWKRRRQVLEGLLASERKRVERLQLQLTVKSETGLPNSVVVHRELDQLLAASPTPKAVIFLALDDRFGMMKRTFSKRLNEWILYQTSLRIQMVLGDRGRLYHTRDEEFFLVVEHFDDPAEIAQMARQLVDRVEKSHVFQGQTISLRVNLGVALYPDHGSTKSELLRNADIALYEAVRNRVGFLLFSKELRDKMTRDVQLLGEINRALEAQATPDVSPQFELYLQPQVEVRQWGTSRVQGRVIGAEALLRWNHPDPTIGSIPPTTFIPLAEETGLIIPLGQWVLHSAINYIKELQKLGQGKLKVSVNFSAAQFKYEDLSFMVQSVVRNRGVDPAALGLEITESGLMDDIHDAMHKVASLRDAGFLVSVDDFGTGYSNLSFLKDLAVDTVKIDRSFIEGVPDSPSEQALTRAIITLAHDLNMGITVEGVEHRRQVDWLFQQGCTVFQGFYFGKPMPFQAFVKYLADFPQMFAQKANRGA